MPAEWEQGSTLKMGSNAGLHTEYWAMTHPQPPHLSAPPKLAARVLTPSHDTGRATWSSPSRPRRKLQRSWEPLSLWSSPAPPSPSYPTAWQTGRTRWPPRRVREGGIQRRSGFCSSGPKRDRPMCLLSRSSSSWSVTFSSPAPGLLCHHHTSLVSWVHPVHRARQALRLVFRPWSQGRRVTIPWRPGRMVLSTGVRGWGLKSLEHCPRQGLPSGMQTSGKYFWWSPININHSIW